MRSPETSWASTRGAVSIRAVVHGLVVVWLVLVFVAQNAPREVLQYAAAAAILFLPVGLLLIGYRPVSLSLVSWAPIRERVAFSLFLVFGLIGSLLSIDPTTSIGFLVLTTFIMLHVSRLWIISAEGVRDALLTYSAIGVPLVWLANLMFATAAPEQLDSRLAGFRNPNSIGLIAYGIAILALGIERKAARWSVFGLAVVTIFATQSRSSILGLVIACSIYAWNYYALRGIGARYVVLVGLMILGLTGIYFADEILRLVDEAFALDNPYRGLDSGYTGRDKLWAFAWDLFLENPLLGVGFRLHEQYFLAGEMDYFVAGSAHNGFLATLCEVGILGSAPLFCWLASRVALLASVMRSSSSFARLGIPLLSGYFAIAVFERYLINLGNPTSVAVLFFLCVPSVVFLRDSSRRGEK